MKVDCVDSHSEGELVLTRGPGGATRSIRDHTVNHSNHHIRKGAWRLLSVYRIGRSPILRAPTGQCQLAEDFLSDQGPTTQSVDAFMTRILTT